MAVDNPYTGGKSSLEDLARMRSLKRSFAIAHKEGQENVRRARNVNDAADPSWEVSQRLRDRMAKTLASYVPRDMFASVDAARSGEDLVSEELLLARSAGYGMQENVSLSARAARKLEKRLAARGLSVLETPSATSSTAAIQYADSAMGALFKKKPTPASEEKAKPASPGASVPGGLAQLTSPDKINVTPTAAAEDYDDDVLVGLATKVAAKTLPSFTADDIFNGLSQSQRELYTTGAGGKSAPRVVSFLRRYGRNKNNGRTKDAPSFTYDSKAHPARFTKDGRIAIPIISNGKVCFRALTPYNPAIMTDYGDYGVKIYANPAEKSAYEASLVAASAQK